MKIIVSLLLLGYCLTNTAQDFNNYTPLACSGPLPTDFTDRASEKAKEDIKINTNTSDSYKERADRNQFLLKSNYMIDELLISGRVLFGDPVTKYVNTVADKLLVNDPKLRKELRFYCLKSNVTNAFTTNQGIIFVTLGLISQLENEAQLAQVLAHEITHYTRKHVINTFLESSRINNNSGNYKYNSYDDNIIKLSNYSKSLEFEADSAGYFRLKDAGYSIREALSVFDILQFSYLPFEEEPFDYTYFETEEVKIPGLYKLDTLMPIHFIDDYDDRKSTHPNVKKRRAKIEQLIGNDKSGKKYLQSKELFNKVRTISRFESVRLNNKNTAYVKAIYNAQILLKDYPESDFLKKSILKSLYGISKCKMRNKYYKISDDFDEYEGEISAVYHFFETLSEEQLTSITLEKLNEYYLDKNKDKQIEKLMINLIEDLVLREKFEFKEYYQIKITDTIAIVDSIDKKEEEVDEDLDDEPTSKYAKLRAIKKKQESSKKVIKDPVELDKIFHHQYLYTASNKKQLEAWFNNVEEEEKPDYKTIKKEKNVYKSANMQTDKVVFVDPDYFMFDEKKGQKLENAEVKKFEFISQLERISDKANLDYNILSIKKFNTNDVEKYNEIARINYWVNEKLNLQKLLNNNNFIPTETEYIEDLVGKYGTSIFIYSGVIQYKDYKNNSYIYTLVFDLNQTSTYIEHNVYLNHKINQANINSQLYKTLIHIKK